FVFSSRRRHTRSKRDWSSDVCSSDLCSILMHPTDAANRGLLPGQKVVVRSRVGSIVLPVEVSEEIMPGVVSIPHGWGHDRDGNRSEERRVGKGGRDWCT